MKKNCTTCKFSEWQTTSTGKRKLNSAAKCNYPEIKLPHSYADYRGDMPRRRHITKYTVVDCPSWEKR